MIENINLAPFELIDRALKNNEGVLAENGALVINTGKYTGRSPDDKFIVKDELTEDLVDWGKVNRPITKEVFDNLENKLKNYRAERELFVVKGFAGADKRYQKKFKVICDSATQCLFCENMLIVPNEQELTDFGEADITIYACPKYYCDPSIDGTNSEAAIFLDYSQKKVLIAGTAYSGEIKKSIFSMMNFYLPLEGVLPMHCSGNVDPITGNSALFFGLSGTGKTTLSADSKRYLIGDDEHGFSDEGVFNIEGGCYAKCIDLKKEKEPQIYAAIKYGTILENVVLDENGVPDYSDASLTENTRASYPLEYIDNALLPSVAKVPSTIIFLTADAFGVLPPISILNKEAAMYHFLTGFTAKVAGTERGVVEPQPTFSTLFGGPFMPLKPSTYAKMLGDKLDKNDIKVYLINTGWQGGSAANGAKRISLAYTRAMVDAALNNNFENVELKHSEILNLDFPCACDNVPSEILDPRNSWADKEAYDKQASLLAKMFADNFAKNYGDVSETIKKAGPCPSK